MSLQTCQALIALGKPKVVLLMLLSALVGMLLAAPSPHWPGIAQGLIGIGLLATAGAAYNHIADRCIDSKMARTAQRPLPSGQLSLTQAGSWAASLTLLGWLTLAPLSLKAACLTLATMLGYAWVYTCLLKYRTPQNIVIGGLSGALPPLLGWATVSPHLGATPWLLVLIIFVWTPPHFWALALARKEDYALSNLPMLPITHGERYTLDHIWYYSILTVIASLFPILITTFGAVYALGLLPLNARWLQLAWQIKQGKKAPMALFVYSITYLMLLFALMLIDHFVYLPI